MKEIHPLFDQLATQVPHPELESRILARVDMLRVRRARLQFAFATTVGISAFAGAIPALQFVTTELTQSGFFSYSALLFSDAGAIFSFWQEFLLTLIEALPVLAISLLVSMILIFVFALQIALSRLPDAWERKYLFA